MVKNKICAMSLLDYSKLKESGMFWELYPEATGYYKDDRALSAKGMFKVEQLEHSKITFKSRYNDLRTFENLTDIIWKISGKSEFIRIIGELESIDYEGGPFISVGEEFNSIGIVEEILPLNESKEYHSFLIRFKSDNSRK